MPHQTTHQISQEMQECINACTRCHAACLATVQHCLEMGGKHADPAHIGVLLDCAEICQTNVNFMLRASDRYQLVCQVCADVCRACAESCERTDKVDEQMQECAQECRRCQESCERMAA